MNEWRMTLTQAPDRIVVEPHPAFPTGHPVMSPDGRAIWDGHEGWFWVLPETDGESFYCTIDAEGPEPPWMDFVQDGNGLHTEMFPEVYDGAAMAKALLEMGVAPDQPFFVHMTFEYNRGDGWETDDEMIIEWEVLDVEALDPAVAAERWANWLVEWRGEVS